MAADSVADGWPALWSVLFAIPLDAAKVGAMERYLDGELKRWSVAELRAALSEIAEGRGGAGVCRGCGMRYAPSSVVVRDTILRRRKSAEFATGKRGEVAVQSPLDALPSDEEYLAACRRLGVRPVPSGQTVPAHEALAAVAAAAKRIEAEKAQITKEKRL